jgi:NitT/TauT family transport system substrate-binding protein
MQRVAQFSFDKGLLGEGRRAPTLSACASPATSPSAMPPTRLRFDDSYLKMAAAGQL